MPITIGRTATTILINDFSISKQHLIVNFSKEQNAFYISDLKSTNGTYLVLSQGDKVQIIRDMKFKIFESIFRIQEIE